MHVCVHTENIFKFIDSIISAYTRSTSFSNFINLEEKIAEQERMQKRTFTTLHIFSPEIIDDSLGRTSTSQIETLSEY